MNSFRHRPPRRRFHAFHLETLFFLLFAAILVIPFQDAFRVPKDNRPAPSGFQMEFLPSSAADRPDLFFGLHDVPFVPETDEPPETNAERDAWTVEDLSAPPSVQETSPIRFPVSATEISVSPAPPLFPKNGVRTIPKPNSNASSDGKVEMSLFYGPDELLPTIVIEADDIPFAEVSSAEARALAAPPDLQGTNAVLRTSL